MKWNENEYLLLVKTQPNSLLGIFPQKPLHVLIKPHVKKVFSNIFNSTKIWKLFNHLTSIE